MKEENERNARIIELWEGGMNYYALSREFNLSVCRIQHLIADHMETERMRKKYGEIADLPSNVRNALLRNGYTKKEQIVFKLKTGTFWIGRGMGLSVVKALEGFTGLKIRTEDGEIPTYYNIKRKRLKGEAR